MIRLVGAVLAEQHNERTEGHRCLGRDVLARGRVTLLPDTHRHTLTREANTRRATPLPPGRDLWVMRLVFGVLDAAG
jgi:putative transposase